MKLTINSEKKIAGQWFRRWFNSPHYHRLYAKHDEAEANEFIDRLIAELQPCAGSRMLDAGCGTGRHSKHLHEKGFDVTGFDLAPASIQQAKRSELENLKFFRHDMRKPFAKEYFDYVFNFFTSFGYFDDHNENRAVIGNFSAALKPGGILMIDYLNADYAAPRLILSEEREIDGIVYHITRWMDDRFFFKKILIDENQVGAQIQHTEQVAKFSLEDFLAMLNEHNLQLQQVYGDYELNDYDCTSSPRMIMVAQKGV